MYLCATEQQRKRRLDVCKGPGKVGTITWTGKARRDQPQPLKVKVSAKTEVFTTGAKLAAPDADLPPPKPRATRRTAHDLDGALENDKHHLYVITAANTAVGTLWFSVEGGRAFLDAITVAEAHRGNGYGRRALELMDVELKQLGVRLVQLNVYAHYPRARTPYDTLGYEVTGVKMTKRIARVASETPHGNADQGDTEARRRCDGDRSALRVIEQAVLLCECSQTGLELLKPLPHAR